MCVQAPKDSYGGKLSTITCMDDSGYGQSYGDSKVIPAEQEQDVILQCVQIGTSVKQMNIDFLKSIGKMNCTKIRSQTFMKTPSQLGEKINAEHEIDLPINPLTAEQSKFFKKVYYNTPKNNKEPKIMYDIVFISYNEALADHNFKLLCDRFPLSQRVKGVKGIHKAHIEAAEVTMTKMFWVVDADVSK